MKKPLTDEEGEVRELTVEDMKLFRPIQEVDPGMGGESLARIYFCPCDPIRGSLDFEICGPLIGVCRRKQAKSKNSDRGSQVHLEP